jgi:hypothetical protein
MRYDDTSKEDPLSGFGEDFNKFFENYFAKGMPCIFSHGGLKDMKVSLLFLLK